MPKIVRNTLFTAAVVALTAVGLRWHSQIIKAQSQLFAGRTVLASQSFGAPEFPLQLRFNAPQVHLGQTETATISTLASARLDVTTQYPDGSINHPQTVQSQADSDGHYSFNVRVDDFHQLGTFRVSVVATDGGKTTQAISEFQVTTWQLPVTGSSGPLYTFPLVP